MECIIFTLKSPPTTELQQKIYHIFTQVYHIYIFLPQSQSINIKAIFILFTNLVPLPLALKYVSQQYIFASGFRIKSFRLAAESKDMLKNHDARKIYIWVNVIIKYTVCIKICTNSSKSKTDFDVQFYSISGKHRKPDNT